MAAAAAAAYSSGRHSHRSPLEALYSQDSVPGKDGTTVSKSSQHATGSNSQRSRSSISTHLVVAGGAAVPAAAGGAGTEVGILEEDEYFPTPQSDGPPIVDAIISPEHLAVADAEWAADIAAHLADEAANRRSLILHISKYDSEEGLQNLWRRKNPDAPHFGWTRVGRAEPLRSWTTITSHPSPARPIDCEMCGAESRKHIVGLVHPDFPELGIIYVGNICASFLITTYEAMLAMAAARGII
jgi:hypothetical protein